MPEPHAVGSDHCVKGKSPKLKRLVQVLLFTGLWAVALFWSAGRLDWTRGWIYFGITLLGFAVNALVTNWKNPELIAERGKRHKGTKGFDKVFIALYFPAVLGLPVVAGVDAVRFGWAPLPWATLWPGIVLQLLGMAPVAWAMATNPHLEATVRIQHDRGHKVISTGPYAYVRHPFYLGGLVGLAGAPLVLGSAWALAVVGYILVLLVFRTALEDRTLRRELPGYEEYAQRTRYRLVPGLW